MPFLYRGFAVLIVLAMVSLPVLAASNELKQVNAKNICFINKTRFNHSLKSVTVEGKTYYGCCQDCLAKLTQDPTSRMDVDPVSGNPVDKAVAVIGVDKNGKIYFFESRENMKKFRAPEEIPTGL